MAVRTFNELLLEHGIAPADVRLLRHKDSRSSAGRSPYDLWKNYPSEFERYQSTQSIKSRKKLSAPFWASFVVDDRRNTIFAGLYHAKYLGLLAADQPKPQVPNEIDYANTCDEFQLTNDARFAHMAGQIAIDWGKGARSWIQRAEL